MKKRDILVLALIVLTILDIIMTYVIVSNTSYAVESNPIMRYMMSFGEWNWMFFKGIVTMFVIFLIYKFEHQFRLRFLVLVNTLLLAVVLNNTIVVILMNTTHSDLF